MSSTTRWADQPEYPAPAWPGFVPFNERKNSAEGTLSVQDALRVFSIWTLVATKFNEQNNELESDIIRNRESSFLTTDYNF